MAGLPRSGSTVLAAILNQNPSVYSSPQTDLLEMLYQLHESIPNYESHKAGLLHSSYKAVVNEVAQNFYSPIKKPIIIDKNRGWGTPYNFDNLAPYVNKNGKVVLTLRPILEILASFVKVSKSTKEALHYTPFLNRDFWVSSYRTEEDAQIESLMQLNGEIDRAIFSTANLLKNHGNRVFVVWYDNLIERPQETMNGIYDFLEIDRYEHDFKSIKEVDSHDDLNAYGVIGLHDLSSSLKKANTNPADYLSKYIIEKYSNALDFFWS